MDTFDSRDAVMSKSGGLKLAESLRPTSLDDILGQDKILAKGAALRKMLENGAFDSLIFVGPPGTGKTTAARIVGELLAMPFHQMHATTAGAADLKKISDVARQAASPVLLFIDEIHRYNKTQQNLLLKMIDDRYIKIISASTENPTYTLVPAFRSRSFIFSFSQVNSSALKKLYGKAEPLIKQSFGVEHVEQGAVLDKIIGASAGDARRFLNLLELAALMAEKHDDKLLFIEQGLEDLIQTKRFDEDEYYDLLSAMIKSLRGSDPDATLLWALKMIESGVSPEAVFRRLMISASEDIGNAYPGALQFITAAYTAFMNVGLPEGMIILAHAVTFLASCPKSNRSYLALHAAEEYLREHDPVVPANIRHSPEGYIYPHDKGGFVKQVYRPADACFYEPSDNGQEQKIAERLSRLWK